MHMSRLKGKVAFVTGGSRGIGAQVARHLAAEGTDVAITYVRSSDSAQQVVKDIDALGRKAMAIAADSADAAAVVSAVEQVVKEFGRIDIVVNNAGFFDT